MRNLIILLLLAILGCQSSKISTQAHTKVPMKPNPFYKFISEFNGDTLQYLTYNFVDYKEQYAGKKLNVLLNDLEIPVNSFRHSYRFKEGATSSSLTLLLSGAGTKKRRKHQPALSSYSISVRWEKPLSKNRLSGLYQASDKDWNADWDNNQDSLESFLGEQAITNVGITNHSRKDTASSNPFYKPFAEFQGDTLQYLTYNFKAYAEQYEGQTFEALYRDLEIPVQAFEYGHYINSPPSSGLHLYFYRPYYQHPAGHRYAEMSISWKTRIPRDEILERMKDRNRIWNSTLTAFFSQSILAEVYVEELSTISCTGPATMKTIPKRVSKRKQL